MRLDLDFGVAVVDPNNPPGAGAAPKAGAGVAPKAGAAGAGAGVVDPNRPPPAGAGAGVLPNNPPPAGAGAGVEPNKPPPAGAGAGVDPNNPPDGAGAEVLPKRLPPAGAGADEPNKLPPGAGADDPNKLPPGAGAGDLPNKLVVPVDGVPKRLPPGAGAFPKRLVLPGAPVEAGSVEGSVLTMSVLTCWSRWRWYCSSLCLASSKTLIPRSCRLYSCRSSSTLACTWVRSAATFQIVCSCNWMIPTTSNSSVAAWLDISRVCLSDCN